MTKLEKLAENGVHIVGHSFMITIPKKFIDKHGIKKFDKMTIYEKGDMLIMRKE